MDPSLVILAAGMASRYGRLKQLDPIGPGGEAILDYTLFDGFSAGFSRFVFVIRPELEDRFRAHLGARLGDGVEVQFAHQVVGRLPADGEALRHRTKPWGTGHAVLAAHSHVEGSFAVANADDFYGRDAMKALGSYLASPESWALVGYQLDRTLSSHGGVSRGICCVGPEGWLEGVREVKEVRRGPDGRITGQPLGGEATSFPSDAIASMNLWGFTDDVFAVLDEEFERFLEGPARADGSAEFVLPEVVQTAVHGGRARVRVLPTAARWIGVTFPEDHGPAAEALRRLHDEGHYPEDLAKALLERTTT